MIDKDYNYNTNFIKVNNNLIISLMFNSIAVHIYYNMGLVVMSKIYLEYVMIYHQYLYLITLLKLTPITLVSNVFV